VNALKEVGYSIPKGLDATKEQVSNIMDAMMSEDLKKFQTAIKAWSGKKLKLNKQSISE